MSPVGLSGSEEDWRYEKQAHGRCDVDQRVWYFYRNFFPHCYTQAEVYNQYPDSEHTARPVGWKRKEESSYVSSLELDEGIKIMSKGIVMWVKVSDNSTETFSPSQHPSVVSSSKSISAPKLLFFSIIKPLQMRPLFFYSHPVLFSYHKHHLSRHILFLQILEG